MNAHRLYRKLCLSVVCAAACGGAAAPTPQHAVQPQPDVVLQELARRSGRSAAELRASVAHCDADQQSMYWCAYREVVAQDIKLKRTVGEKASELATCQVQLASKVAEVERSRAAECQQAALEEYSGGSMQQTAQNMCRASSTAALVNDVAKLTDCEALAKL